MNSEKMIPEVDWATSTRQFQQNLGQECIQALQSFQLLNTGEAPVVPQLRFSPEKLEALQKAYLSEAAQLWNHGLAGPAGKDKRFASDAWSANPLAAYSAALYLLNARALLGLAEAAETDAKPRRVCASRSNNGWRLRRPATS
jgi:polyhydroxyalkanoate synthase